MNATVSAIRAITSVYARQLLRPILWIGIAVYVFLLVVIGLIAYSASNWWWLLATVPSLLFVIGLVVWTITWVLSGRIAPQMNKAQLVATKKFVKHIGYVAEHMGLSRFTIIVQIIKDVVTRPKEGTFIGELAQKPGEMRRDFENLRKLF
jgi:hypothetical protein